MDSSSSSSPATLVSRAKTALHSAAAKAEKVLTDIKADLKTDRNRGRDGDAQSQKTQGKHADQAPADASASGKPQDEFLKRCSFEKDDFSSASTTAIIHSASVLKHLAVAFRNGKNFRSLKDLSSDGDPSSKERTGLRFSVVKSLVLHEREEKSNSDISNHVQIPSLIRLLFDSEEHFPKMTTEYSSGTSCMTYLPRDIRGAPPESFLVRLSEIIGGCKSLRKMASIWHSVVAELRRLWTEGKPIPFVPLDENPDLNSCHLHQQLQVINCCIARKLRRTIAIESLDSVVSQTSPNPNSVDYLEDFPSSSSMIYARMNTGELVLRLGADHPSDSLTMLETGEPIYSPVTQEGPVLTEELIRETEEFVLRTGSVGAGCSQLLSDMQAFKAANPGCILEDFIRWYSPPDWTETELDSEANDSSQGEDVSSRRGCLSKRMQKEGNLWRELWETARALPAVKQTPLFDEDLAVESILTSMEDISPSELLEQLFLSLLSSGFAIGEAALPADSKMSKLFTDCKEYVVATCQSGMSNDNIGDLCKVYETMETIILHPEAIEISEEGSLEEPKSRFKKISLNFVSKDRKHLPKRASKEHKKSDHKNVNVFSNLFDGKTSLFLKKRQTKSDISAHAAPTSPDENDWTNI